jgi:hypothetical protein
MNSLMQRCIVGFNQDEEAHWVAEFECSHQQHGGINRRGLRVVGNHG